MKREIKKLLKSAGTIAMLTCLVFFYSGCKKEDATSPTSSSSTAPSNKTSPVIAQPSASSQSNYDQVMKKLERYKTKNGQLYIPEAYRGKLTDVNKTINGPTFPNEGGIYAGDFGGCDIVFLQNLGCITICGCTYCLYLIVVDCGDWRDPIDLSSPSTLKWGYIITSSCGGQIILCE